MPTFLQISTALYKLGYESELIKSDSDNYKLIKATKGDKIMTLRFNNQNPENPGLGIFTNAPERDPKPTFYRVKAFGGSFIDCLVAIMQPFKALKVDAESLENFTKDDYGKIYLRPLKVDGLIYCPLDLGPVKLPKKGQRPISARYKAVLQDILTRDTQEETFAYKMDHIAFQEAVEETCYFFYINLSEQLVNKLP